MVKRSNVIVFLTLCYLTLYLDCTPSSGRLEVNLGEEFSVTSPGYAKNQSYEPFTSCSWLLQVRSGH